MTYVLSMRTFTILALALSFATPGCRTTHDADSEELSQLSTVDATLETGSEPDDDFGQFSLGSLSAVYAPLKWLSNKDRAEGSSESALTHTTAQLELLPAVQFVGDGSRDEWPECITEFDDGVIYDDCVLGISMPNISVGFSADGEYHWGDNSSTSDLTFDFGAELAGLGIGTSVAWIHDLAWTDTTLDGSFDLDYVAGVTLNAAATPTSVSLSVTGSIEGLLRDEVCAGPIAGVLDWRSRYREGLDPIEVTRVTVEWLACDVATVTW